MNRHTLAIDPGMRTGWAWFEDRALVACGHVVDPEKFAQPPYWPTRADVWIEQPHDQDRIPVNDLVKLTIRAGWWGGVCAAWGGQVKYLYPRTWKGSNLSKKISHDRIREDLSAAELAVTKQMKSKDMWDAIGIGLHVNGRSIKGGVAGRIP